MTLNADHLPHRAINICKNIMHLYLCLFMCTSSSPSSMSSSVLLCPSAMATLPLITGLAGILGGSSVSPAMIRKHNNTIIETAKTEVDTLILENWRQSYVANYVSKKVSRSRCTYNVPATMYLISFLLKHSHYCTTICF